LVGPQPLALLTAIDGTRQTRLVVTLLHGPDRPQPVLVRDRPIGTKLRQQLGRAQNQAGRLTARVPDDFAVSRLWRVTRDPGLFEGAAIEDGSIAVVSHNDPLGAAGPIEVLSRGIAAFLHARGVDLGNEDQLVGRRLAGGLRDVLLELNDGMDRRDFG